MIRPAALYNKARFSRDFASLGRVAAVLCGNAHISRTDLTDAELSALEEIENENDEMDKVTKREAERKAAYRAKVSRNVPQCPTDNAGQVGQDGASAMSAPTIHTTNQPTNHTNNQTNTTRSVPVPKVDGNGTDGLKVEAGKFVKALKADGSGSEIYNPDWSPVVVIAALTGDYESHRRWRQCVNQLGEDRVREECFTFYREIKSGEDPDNRGAALNKRFKKMGVK